MDDSTRVMAEAPAAPRAIPLELGPLLAPYKKRGRLSLRIERLPRSARLSGGRNNGDGSWSLTLDELEDLAYLLPEGMDEEHTLAIRIIGLDGGAGTTLAVRDFLISPGAAGSGTRDEEAAAVGSPVGPGGDMPAPRLRNELAEVQAPLVARDPEPGKTRERAERAETESSKQRTETEPATARAALKAELDENKFASLTAGLLVRKGDAPPPAEFPKAEPDESRFAGTTAELLVRKGEARPSMIAPPPAEASARADIMAAREQGDGELRRLRDECAAMQAALADRETALARAGLDAEAARERWQQESDAALSKARMAWKADEAARLAAVEARWQEQSRRISAEARAEAEAARGQGDGELRRLRDECARMQASIADREAELAQMRAATAQARERWQQETQETLLNAENAWKTEAAAQRAAAEAQSQDQSARKLAAVTARCQQAEAALLTRVHADADAIAARERSDGELRRLHVECATMQASIADREAELAQMRAATEQARKRWQQESDAALSKARTAWKDDEAARLAAAEARWQEQSKRMLAEAHAEAEAARERWQQESDAALSKARTAWKADAAAQLAAAEAQWQEQSKRALAETHAEAEAARDQGDGELRRLRDECARMQAGLADREAELAQMRAAAEQARERWQRETQGTLLQAERAWKADESARFAASEAQWRKQSARALAEATARYEAAETALAQMRIKNKGPRDTRDNVEANRLRNELAAVQTALLARETELAYARSAMGQSRERPTPETKIVLRTTRGWGAGERMEPKPPARAGRRPTRDIVLAACVVVAAILLYPWIEPLVPESWRSNIAAITAGNEPIAPAESLSHAPPQEHMALVVRGANLRAGPSATAPVISTLQRGLQVATLEQRGNWMLVQIGGENGKTQPRRGWVFSTFLKDAGGSDMKPPAAKGK